MPRSLRIVTPIAATTIAALALAGCSSTDAESTVSGETITVENAAPAFTTTDEADTTDTTVVDTSVEAGSVEVPYQPSAIVVFDLATLDTLDAIGAGDSVVGIPDIVLPDYLADYADLPKVGSLFEPDFEAVVELDPDLIVTAARSSAAYDELAEITTTIDMTAGSSGAFDPDAAIVRAEQWGEIFGVEDTVADLAAEIESTQSELIEATADLGPTLFLAVTGGDYGAYAEESRYAYFFTTLGFTPAIPEAELPGTEGSEHGEVVSNEFILATDPEWILVLDRGAAIGDSESGLASEALDNELVNATTAAEDGHIIYLPASEVYIVLSGLTAVQNVLDTVADGIAE